MDEDFKSLDMKGGVLQCQPTKAHKEAHTIYMENNITKDSIPTWDYLLFDLNAVSIMATLLKNQSITGYSVAVLYEAYALLCKLKQLRKKIKRGYYDISLKDLSKSLYFGNSKKKDTQNAKKVLDLLSKVSFCNQPPLIRLEKRTGDIYTVYLYKKFDLIIKQIIDTSAEHDCVKINSDIYNIFLSKLKKQQRAYAVLLEKIFQANKNILEKATFSCTYSRQDRTLQRINKTFAPKNKHTAKEIFNSGSDFLKKHFGDNFEDQIQKLSKSLITTDEIYKFAEKKNTVSINYGAPIAYLFDEQLVMNDKFFNSDSEKAGS